jgi:hypothetical protein
MDPVQKIWMYENWIQDQNDMSELTKNHAYLLASFDHPEQVKKLLGKGQVFESTDEEFDELSKAIKNNNLEQFGLTSKPTTNNVVNKRRRNRATLG